MESQFDPLGSLRFLEIGVDRRFKIAYPEQTDFFYTGTRHHSHFGPGSQVLSPVALWKIVGRLRRGEYDLIVVHPPLYPAWHLRTILHVIRYRPLTFPVGLFSTLAFHFLRLVRRTPIVVTDMLDSFGIPKHNFFLFDLCRTYYKRELPSDNWLVFYGTGHRNLPGRSFRTFPRFQRYIKKLRPISIGASSLFEQSDTPLPEKTSDLFFSGTIGSSSAREKGLAHVLALRERGIRVDIPDKRLPWEEFHKRCAAAWLVWSPGGFGWDCVRHYEAAMAGSVVVMNYPSIEMHQPLRHGEHCLYYGVEGEHLAETIVSAIENRPQLEKMAQAARKHSLAHHTYKALAKHIVRNTLELPAENEKPAHPRESTSQNVGP